MPEFDVFLSHATADKAAVEVLARKLRDEKSLCVFFDRWELVPGTPWQEALEEALRESRTCAVFVGPQGIAPWHNAELRTALTQRVRNEPKRVIPVLLPGAVEDDVPAFLAQRTWVDFRSGLDDENALRHLVAGISGRAGAASEDAVRSSENDQEMLETWSRTIRWLGRGRAWQWGGLIGLAGVILTALAWFFPRPPVSPSSTVLPALYAVRVQVLDPEGQPVGGSTLRVSSGNEPHLLPDGWWQVEIPAVKVPVDGMVVLWADHPLWSGARTELRLGEDANPRLEIRLASPESRIVGLVTDADGEGVRDARVTARGLEAPPVATDRDGRFVLRISTSSDRRVRLHVEHPEFPPKDSFCYAGSDACVVRFRSP